MADYAMPPTPVMKSGTLGEILDYLVGKNEKPRLMHSFFFLISFPKLLGPSQLLQELQKRYLPTKTSAIPEGLPLFLEQWIDYFGARDFFNVHSLRKLGEKAKRAKTENFDCLMKFLDALAEANGAVLANRLKLSLIKCHHKRNSKSPTALPKVSRPEIESKFSDFMPTELAEQMTWLESRLFASIQVEEFFDQAWRKDSKHILSPNLVEVIQLFNRVSHWVASEILSKPASSVATIKRFVSLAYQYYNINNFNGVMEILAGFNMWAVQRLKKVWSAVPPKYMAKVKKLEQLMENNLNYKNYRTALNRCKTDFAVSSVPCLPYMGVYLRDLTFIDENPDWLNPEKTIINFEKIIQFGDVILEIRLFQQSNYCIIIRDNPQIVDYLMNLPSLSPEQLEEESARIQPMSEKLLTNLSESSRDMASGSKESDENTASSHDKKERTTEEEVEDSFSSEGIESESSCSPSLKSTSRPSTESLSPVPDTDRNKMMDSKGRLLRTRSRCSSDQNTSSANSNEK